MRSADDGDRPHGPTIHRRSLLRGGLAFGLIAVTGCAADAGRARLLAARPMLRTHALLLADAYGMQSANGLALVIDEVPRVVGDLAGTARNQLRTDERIDTLASVAPAPDLSAPRPDPGTPADPEAPPPIAIVEPIVDPDELTITPLARNGLTRALTIVRTRRDDLEATALLDIDGTTVQLPFVVAHGLAELAAHRIAVDTETIDDDQLPWWIPRLREKYRQANAVASWRRIQGDGELTRSARYRLDVAGTWTVEGNTQISGERHVEIDWQPSPSESRRSELTIRQGTVNGDDLATWNERFTTTRTYDHTELWGP